MKRILIVSLVLWVTTGIHRLRATHIVGAELYYECVDSVNHVYDLTLKLYRDCQNGQAPYDPNIVLFIFDGVTGANFQTINIPVPANTPEIQPEDWDACVATPPQICVEEGIYATTISLPPNPNGYNLGWSRCCRNAAITNLSNPLGEGITFLAHIPGSGSANCNSMPQFDQVPPVFLCVNQQFSFDHSATDPDGDSLAYALTNPYTGTNFAGLGTGNPMMPGGNPPTVDPFTNPMGPPPYTNVNFAAGFNFLDPFGSNNFTIDPLTGFIDVTPTQTGIFVFSISVFEYRNGVLLSENRRDFQIHVIACLSQGAPPAITHDLTGLNFSNDTIFVNAGVPFCYDVTIQDPVLTDTVTAYTVSASFGNGTFVPPLATFNFSGINPIQGQVCWTPACIYNGQTIPMIIGGYDVGDCENVAHTFDTVWVVISQPPNQPPVISPDYSGLTVVGDTIFVTANDTVCYTVTASDPNTGDILTLTGISPIFTASVNPPIVTFSGTNPRQAEICWIPGCDKADQLFQFTMMASDMSLCNTPKSVTTTIYIKVLVPPNNAPVISTNLSGNIFSNDTIFVDALDNLCFNFSSTDPDLGDVLTFQSFSPIFNVPNGPVVTTTGTNPLSGQICWTPGCQYENQVIPLIFGTQDQGVCANIGKTRDTIYVKVSVPPNAPPQLDFDLTGNIFSNDSIFVSANEALCFDYLVTDPNMGDVLTVDALSPIFNLPNGPTFSSAGTNPVSGQICWTPSCDFVGQVVELVVEAVDNGLCSSQKTVLDTVYVVILTPPNDPPVITHNLNGLDFSGDTIFADASVAFCYNVIFTDINSIDTLTAFTVSPIFTGNNAATFSYTGINPLQGQVCWTPSCDNEGQLIEIILRVEDNGDCDNILEDFDTVYVKVSDPLTIAPIVGHDISGNPFIAGDTIYIEITDSLCYDFFIADQTTNNGINYNYEFQNLGGTNLGLASANVVFSGDSIIGSVCFKADCSNGGSLYRSIITGIDKETCPPFKSASDTVYIKVNTSFLSFAGTDTSFCQGTGGVQLNVVPIGGVAPYYFNWDCDDPGNCGFSNPYIANPVVNPTDTTTYFVQIADKNGCTSEFDNVVVNVKRLPIVDAGPDTFICEGGPGIGLHCTVLNPLEAPGPYTYTWIPSTGLNNPNIVNPHARPDSTTIYTVIVGSANGCTSDNTNLDTLSTVVVTVRERPVVEAGPDRSICLGDTTQLLGHATEAGPNYDFIWTPATGLTDSSNQAPIASPPITTTYFLVAWSNSCPSVADSVTINVHTLPTANPGSSYEICGGDTIRLNGIAGGDSTATYTYQWSPSAGLDDPASPTPLANPTASTVYSLVATSSYGCKSPAYQVGFTVLPAPIANAGPDGLICRGDSILLQGSHTMIGGQPTGPVFYAWTPADGMSGLFVPQPTTSPSQTTLYTLTVSSGACSTQDEVKVDVFAAIEVSVMSDTSTICSGESVRLTAQGGSGSAVYLWTPAEGLDDPSSPSPLARPDVTTTYSVEISEGACKGEKGITIQVFPTPVLDYISSREEGCADFTVNFYENTQSGIAFIWDFGDGSPISNEAFTQHTYSQAGTYAVNLTATGAGGCQVSGSLGEITIGGGPVADFISDPQPGTSLPLPDARVQFNNRSTGAVSWFWDFGDGGFSTAENPTYTYGEAGTYYVMLIATDAGGCVDSVKYGPLTVFPPDVLIPNVFSPNGDGINDLFWVKYNGKETVYTEVFDRWGRPIFSGTGLVENAWNGLTASGAEASEGVYYYVVKIGEKTFSGNVTLMR
ncbi:MAG: PKD domain-containing protein [Bacteroidia bacterium]|nr:PKD domain-containing protein [Bacteroidia bacterium]